MTDDFKELFREYMASVKQLVKLCDNQTSQLAHMLCGHNKQKEELERLKNKVYNMSRPEHKLLEGGKYVVTTDNEMYTGTLRKISKDYIYLRDAIVYTFSNNLTRRVDGDADIILNLRDINFSTKCEEK